MSVAQNSLTAKKLVKNASMAMPFLDLQAALGITKHPGGYAATDELLDLCQIKQAKEVLNVGCGIGVGAIYIAQRFGCHVVGVDCSEKMIAWSRQRAHEAHLTHQVEFQVADVCALPFVTDHFDLVICESVLNFVNDKAQALREMVRVTKPGGYVGINETFWQHAPPAGYVPQVQALLGAEQPTAEAWQALWRASGLHAQTVHLHTFDTRQEIKDRIEWIGWVWLVRAWGRALRLILLDPGIRAAIKEQFDFPVEVMLQIGYGLFVGRK